MSSDHAGDLDGSPKPEVDEIAKGFETAWKLGSPPRIEDFLQQLPGDTNPDLLLALIELDIHFRSQHGGAPKLVQYAARFPQQAAVIRDNLVGAYEKTVVPETGDQSDSGQTAVRPLESQRESTSRHVGPFKLLEKLGEGGMGEVYVADQLEPIKRRVALKLIRTGMDNDQMIARFEAERQALAMMDHPHIARVLDAGVTADGQPYFAMELVQGISITKYCDRNRLGIPERLRLFVQVCRAIQHAHQKGILHRDLKPANVLVTQRDGVPLAKVIDFGLAKALQSEQRLTDKTLYTQMGLMVGTLEYMSPEQAEMNELGVDTRTDVYSLGVLFYELLTGSTPLGHDRVRQEAYHRLVELICSEETPAPSRRLSDSEEAIAGISAQRQIDPRRLSGVLKGELDWIALKALAKERDRRYDGAGTLADDVQHFLDGDVVTARPPSAGYRLRKAIRRNKAAFVSGLVLVVSLLLGLIGTGTMWRRAQSESGRANTAESQATQEAATARAAEATAQAEAVKARTAETNAVAARETAERNLSAAEKNAYIFDMLLAQRDWEDAQIGHLKERLNRYRDRADLKGFEWDYWNRLTQRGLSTFKGHSMSVNSVRFSRDGKWVVSGAGQNMESGEIKLWDVESGREMFVLKGQTNNVRCVDLSPDAQRIVSGSTEGILQIWDVTTGQELRTLEGHKSLVLSVDFSPDGKRIVSGSFDKTLKVWDAETGRELHTLTCQYWVYGVAFSPDGKRIASASADRTVRVWDAESGRQLLLLNGHTLAVNCVDFSPDGKRIVSGGADKALKVWDAVTGRQLLTRTAHTQPVTSVRFSPDGKQIVSGSRDNTLKVWDAASGQVTLTLKGHSGWVHSASFSPDGKRIVSGSQDTTLMLWDLATGPEILSLKRYLDPDVGLSFCARFSPDGKRIVSGDENTVKVWDAVTGLETLTIKGHSDRVSSVSFSPDGTRILSSSAPNYRLPVRNDRTLKLWNAATGQESLIINGHSKGVYSASFSRDGNGIVSGSEDKTL
ncbi:MAG: protein kinase, partial [Planctomycetaceae bacterium]